MDSEKKIIGRCPFCDGNVVKTCKGYRCENNTGEHPSCVLNINAIIGNRKMNDEEIAEFLEKRRILLDGFSTFVHDSHHLILIHQMSILEIQPDTDYISELLYSC